MTSSNDKKAIRAIQDASPGMKYTEALRVLESGPVEKMPPPMVIAGEPGWGYTSKPGHIFIGESVHQATPVLAPVRGNILISGVTGAGKTIRLRRLIERAAGDGYEVSIIEGYARGELDGLEAPEGSIRYSGDISDEASALEFIGEPRPGHILVIEAISHLKMRFPATEEAIETHLSIGAGGVVIAVQKPSELSHLELHRVETRILVQSQEGPPAYRQVADELGIRLSCPIERWGAATVSPGFDGTISLAPEAL